MLPIIIFTIITALYPQKGSAFSFSNGQHCHGRYHSRQKVRRNLPWSRPITWNSHSNARSGPSGLPSSSTRLFSNQRGSEIGAKNNPPTRLSQYLPAICLIAGTTVGGGFLALPATVVVPLGGFIPSAGALALVWSYLLTCSLLLCDSILLANKDSHMSVHDDDTSTTTTSTSIGIPKTAQIALGNRGSQAASLLLVSLTVATLVSQLSRAGILLASSNGGSLWYYRMGCTVATLLGVAVTYGSSNTRNSLDRKNGARGDITTDVAESNDTQTTTTTFADKFNAVLTAIFLSSAFLLFRSVSGVANWSACWQIPATTSSSTLAISILALVPKIVQASPIMLQLLVYGEILPNVCRMLDFDRRAVRRAVVLGSLIPLVLLTGWAALGVALLVPKGGSLLEVVASASVIQDPVEIILSTGSMAVQGWLRTLAVSAIGTTILGSLLALQSAFQDWKAMLLSSKHKENETMEESSLSLCRLHSLLNRSWMQALVIAGPPWIISLISPSLFLQAIDFAGSYPVLLLYGILPPLMLHRLNARRPTGGKWFSNRRAGIVMGILSSVMIGGNVISDGGWLLGRILQFVATNQ